MATDDRWSAGLGLGIGDGMGMQGFRRVVKETVGKQFRTATIINVNGDTVDVQSGGSAKLLRGLPVIGGTDDLIPGDVVALHEADGRIYAQSMATRVGNRQVVVGVLGSSGSGLVPHTMEYHSNSQPWHAGLSGTALHNPKEHTHESSESGGDLLSYVHVSGFRFTSLPDAPETYVGQAGKMPAVNGDENALEFVDPASFLAGDASDIPFTPAVVADWDGSVDPGNVDGALNQLAERVADVEGAAGHAAVTLSAAAQEVLSLSTQEIGLVAQVAATVLAGPVSGADAAPDFRALAEGDLPAAIQRSGALQALKGGITIYQASGTLDLSTSYQDIPGLTTGSFTPSVSESVLVVLSVHFRQDQGTSACNVGDILRGALLIDGTAESQYATAVATGNVGSSMGLQFYKLSLGAAAHTIKAQATNIHGARGRVGAVSQMIVWRMENYTT